MASSPDKFHSVRENLADIKSANRCLHLMEMKSHLLMLNDYDDQIFTHYLSLEKMYKPLPQLIAQQPEIRLKMRYLVIDYLLDIVNKFKLTSETFFTSVQLIDRYASVRIIKKSQFQLVGLCCLWISSKFHEKKQNVPTLDDLTKLCCHCYSKKLFINMETHILSSIGWCIGANLESMLDIFIQKNRLYNASDVKLACLYLCQLVQFYKISLNYKSSQITCAALSLVVRALNGYPQHSTPSSSTSSATSSNDLELLLLKLLSKPCPSSMIDQSLHTVILQLKKFYHFREKEDQDDVTFTGPAAITTTVASQQQLLTPPGSATGSIDAGIKYAYTEITQQQPQQQQPLSSKVIYPSPIEVVTPSIRFGMKRNYDSSGEEYEQLPIYKKVDYHDENESVAADTIESLQMPQVQATTANVAVPIMSSYVNDENALRRIENNEFFYYDY